MQNLFLITGRHYYRETSRIDGNGTGIMLFSFATNQDKNKVVSAKTAKV